MAAAANERVNIADDGAFVVRTTLDPGYGLLRGDEGMRKPQPENIHQSGNQLSLFLHCFEKKHNIFLSVAFPN